MDAINQLEIVEVNGKQFVSGLLWKPLHSVRKYQAEAREIGRIENMDMVTIRKSRTLIQAGFAPKRQSGLKGTYSLAAALAGQLGENWIGVFDAGAGRYAIVAVMQGGIVPGYDMIGSFDAVDAKLREVYSLLSSQENGGHKEADFGEQRGNLFAPREFEFSDKSLDLDDLLTAKTVKNAHRLKRLHMGFTTRQTVALGAAAVLLGAGGLFVKAKVDETSEAKARAAEQAAAQLQLQQAGAVQQTPTTKPWETLPDPATLLDACSKHLSATPLAVGGWLFNNARCAPGKAIATFMRMDGGPVTDFVSAAKRIAGVDPNLFEQGSTGSIESEIVVAPAKSEILRHTGDALMGLNAHVQALREDASLALTDKPSAPDPNNPGAPPPAWTTTGFSLQTVIPPDRVLSGVDLTGVRVIEVVTTLNPGTGELAWTINGEIYGQ